MLSQRAGKPSPHNELAFTTATTDTQLRTLSQKLAAASQNVLKLEREASTAEGAIRDLRSQLATARAAASRPVTVESPRPPPIDPARVTSLEHELQSERRRREEVEEELHQLQLQKRSPPRPAPPPAEPRPGLELGAAGFEQLKNLRKEVERLKAALDEESEQRRALQRRLENSKQAPAVQRPSAAEANEKAAAAAELAKLRRELQAQANQAGPQAERDPRLMELDGRLGKLEERKAQVEISLERQVQSLTQTLAALQKQLAQQKQAMQMPQPPPPRPPSGQASARRGGGGGGGRPKATAEHLETQKLQRLQELDPRAAKDQIERRQQLGTLRQRLLDAQAESAVEKMMFNEARSQQGGLGGPALN
eukprot:scaffold16007_cov65-Phaeocystis_antarctica.AAC.3